MLGERSGTELHPGFYFVFCVSFCFKAEPHYAAQAGLELSILLLQPLRFWDYGSVCPLPP